MPFLHDGELHFLYTCNPTVVLRCDTTTGRTVVVHREDAPTLPADLRGGSQGVPLDSGGWLFVVHEVDRSSAVARYLHRFLHLDRSFAVAGLSDRFTFTSDNVEFCGGMARRGSELVLSFGVSDAAAGLAVLQLDEVLDLLEDPVGAPGQREYCAPMTSEQDSRSRARRRPPGT